MLQPYRLETFADQAFQPSIVRLLVGISDEKGILPAAKVRLAMIL